MSEHPNVKAARTQGFFDGVRKERSRCQAIVESPEAAFRDAQAQHLATATDMTPEAARAHLAGLPADPQTRADSAASGFAASLATARGTAPSATAQPAGFGASLAAIRGRH